MSYEERIMSRFFEGRARYIGADSAGEGLRLRRGQCYMIKVGVSVHGQMIFRVLVRHELHGLCPEKIAYPYIYEGQEFFDNWQLLRPGTIDIYTDQDPSKNMV